MFEEQDAIRADEIIQELRELAFRNSKTKDEKVPKSQSLSVGPLDEMFDIDIFFSRKPGMRRSVQMLSSNAKKDEFVTLSCLTALASLCDTMVTNPELHVTEQDIVQFMVGWLDMHHIKIADLRK